MAPWARWALLCCVALGGGCVSAQVDRGTTAEVETSSGSSGSPTTESEPTRGGVGEDKGRAGTDPGTRPRGSGDWRLTRPSTHHQIEAYATRISGTPGTPVGIKVSTSARAFQVSAYRIGAYVGGWGNEVWSSDPLPGRRQPQTVLRPAETRTVVAPWGRDLTVDTTGWEPGYYAFKLQTGSGWETIIPYVVSSESAAGTVALVAPATTWQAYNSWGGYSLYDGPEGDRRSWAVSFDRPWNLAGGANDFRSAAFPVVVRAEGLGVELSYFTNVDVHARPGVLDGARGFISLGHDEYWSHQMRGAVVEARDAGTNVAFFGANTMYWRVRLQDTASGPDRLLVGYRDDAQLDPMWDVRPHETTARFRDAPEAQPEQDLVGMQYECFPVNASYRVVSPGWWGFRGTGVRYGDQFPGLVGPEADRVYPDRRTPRPMQVLSHTVYPCRGDQTSSQSVYYTTDSGAGVFTAGTLRWGCAVIDACEYPLSAQTRQFVRIVTGNVLRAFAAGPVGRRHPAEDNVDDFGLSTLNSVTAS